MKSICLLIVIALVISRQLPAQNCLPQGITFSSQSSINNFQSNYPGCTVIEGNVRIKGDNIANLLGLNVLDSIGGNLTIDLNYTKLTSLAGLEGLTSVGGDLFLNQNYKLKNLHGLDNLTSVGGNLDIEWNWALKNLSGLDNLVSIGNNIAISANDSLNDLSGLNKITNLPGYLALHFNYNLNNLNGLNNLSSIGGNLWIHYNSSITSLTGLEKLTSVGGDLTVDQNYELDNLSTLSGLESIGAKLDIGENNSLRSLSGLSGLSYIGGLSIYSNPRLQNLLGLEGVSNIVGTFINIEIGSNDSLTSLTGLESISAFPFGYMSINGNKLLPGLQGLQNLTSCAEIYIEYNPNLTSLSGIDNIVAGTVNNLTIYKNINLSNCAVKSVCDYIASPFSTVYIDDNASGCYNEEDVEISCLTLSKTELSAMNGFSVFPIPATNQIVIEIPETNGNSRFSICNVCGQEVLNVQVKERISVIDISNLNNGLYFVRVIGGNTPYTNRIVISR